MDFRLIQQGLQTRESATLELKRFVAAARPLLVEARKTSTSAEVQQWLGEMLDYSPHAPPADAVPGLRALAVLERIGTNEAKDALKVLAGGAQDAELSQEAKRICLSC